MLSAADRSRVEKLANMLASDFDGERANAGALLARMASERKVTVAELLGLAQGPATAEPPSPSRLWDDDVDLLDRLAAAVNFTSVLTPWEREYAADVSRRYVRAAQLSERQHAVAERIVVKAKRAALAGAEPDWDEV
ncbi:MAG TPA: hypothetical protein VKA39_00330 [Beijerinckiaceae bacterium]|nr:hypothetical protein [Beijerinckiaceae bacterium]